MVRISGVGKSGMDSGYSDDGASREFPHLQRLNAGQQSADNRGRGSFHWQKHTPP